MTAYRPLALIIASLFAAPSLAAVPASDTLPTGGRVTAGAATVSQNGARMEINQTTDRAILEWQSFNIGSAAQVNFAQPSSSSIALNRVLAGDASQIFGKLTANGQVWLVNPAGVIFGAGSRVDVGGLVASTLDIADSDFLAGRNVFNRNGASGKVVNSGTLNAADGGLVALLAPEVRNQGVIMARLGNVVLAAGERVTLEAGAGGRLHVAVDPATLNTLVENRQMIVADGGQVVMSAQAADRLYSAVVANSGTVQARTLENREGRILLLADMDHGEVQVGGLLDASAPFPPLPLAGEGPGERANGGFVETSAAKVSLAPDHRVTTVAANGKTGTWLIDPNDYTIAAGGGNITGAQLAADLAGSNITISTATQGTAGGNGDIFVNDAVSWSANKLTLNAGRNIAINANLNGSGTASLALEYGQSAVAAGNTADYSIGNGAKVYLPAGANFSTKLGSDGATATYTVITSLGIAGDASTTTLQGIKNNLTGNYVLGSDIEASATVGWNAGAGFEPIGDSAFNIFEGTFSGFGHTISALTINRPGTDGVGLFGVIQTTATLRNVGLLGGSVSGHDSVGGLVGENRGIVSYSYNTGSVTGNQSVGGLLGHHAMGTVTNSYATGNVIGTTYVGGLSGDTQAAISQSYSTGTVNGTDKVGGLVGANFFGSVAASYSTGTVSGTSNVGGLAGEVWGGTTTNSYWNITTSGQGASAAGTGLTTAQMQQQASFAGWDFANTWRIYEGQSYPVLRAFQSNLTVTANNAAKTYDGNAWSGGNGVSYSADGAPLTGTVTYAGTSQAAVNAGSYTITPGGLGFNRTTQQDYQSWGDIGFADGTLTVNKATLTATANAAGKTYDGLAYTGGNGVGYSGFVNGESAAVLGGALAYGGTSQGAVNAGDYVLTPGGLTSGNYTISFVDGTLTVNKAPLTITANADAKSYDGNAYAGGNGVAYTGFVNGETAAVLSGALAYGGNSQGTVNAGSYLITPSGRTAGNYTISFVDGVLTITAVTPAASSPATSDSQPDSGTLARAQAREQRAEAPITSMPATAAGPMTMAAAPRLEVRADFIRLQGE